MRIPFAIGFIFLVAGAAFIAGLSGMSKIETVEVICMVLLMRIAISLEELIVCTKENNIRRFLLNEAQQKEIHRVE